MSVVIDQKVSTIGERHSVNATVRIWQINRCQFRPCLTIVFAEGGENAAFTILIAAESLNGAVGMPQ